ncbi:MAG: acyl-CoA dehydrogenase family protein [Burkholderiales bacterium]|nr:acyl-CoA dehydrogenase family protein [Burkholderiales bacterium]
MNDTAAARATTPLTPAEALERTRALAPRLAARAQRCEDLRRCPDETIAELHASGLMRLMQPRRFGGSELGAVAAVDVTLEMAKTCPSTAWVWMNLASHSWNIAQFALRAQEDVWGDDPGAVAVTSLAFPCGAARPVEGGYVVSGRWPFGSGVDASQWMLAGAMTERAGAPPERRFFLVPRAHFRSLDNWRAYGLAGTGSHDVEVREAFVPAHRSLAAEALAAGTDAPGAKVHASPVYRLPAYATFGFFLAAVPLGAARGAVEQFVAATRGRAGTYTGARRAELAPLQIRIAEASACVDFAETQLRADLAELVGQVEAGVAPPMEDKVRWKRNVAFEVQLAVRAVDTLMTASGAGGLHTAAPLQRLFRDVRAAAAHIALTWDVQAAAYGQHALGVPLQAGLLL